MAFTLFTSDQKKMYAEKLLDLGHLIFGGLVVGQFISNQPCSKDIAIYGIVALVLIYLISYTFTRKRKK